MRASDSGTVSPVPEHLRTVTPRLVVCDGAAAIAFYARAFGAEQVGDRFTGPGGELIHAEIRIGDSVVMITEDAVDGPVSSPERLGGRSPASCPCTGRTWMRRGSGRLRRGPR
jgi:PhnB protein